MLKVLFASVTVSAALALTPAMAAGDMAAPGPAPMMHRHHHMMHHMMYHRMMYHHMMHHHMMHHYMHHYMMHHHMHPVMHHP
jgi:hypothetical protein